MQVSVSRVAASAADYRRLAAECLHLAEQYPISKATLIAMAAAWQRMAEFADRTETMKPFPDDLDHSKF
jgi:hypothetical protein